jgi:hypothetical protein
MSAPNVLLLAHRRQTHRPQCFIVTTRWPDLPWVTMPAADVPAHYDRCAFCGGGR